MNGRDSSPKRLSSIQSILNQNNSSHAIEQTMGPMLSPGRTTASAPSPGSYGSTGAGAQSVGYPSPRTINMDHMADGETAKQERRLALKREAERMREMLAAKERELAELE